MSLLLSTYFYVWCPSNRILDVSTSEKDLQDGTIWMPFVMIMNLWETNWRASSLNEGLALFSVGFLWKIIKTGHIFFSLQLHEMCDFLPEETNCWFFWHDWQRRFKVEPAKLFPSSSAVFASIIWWPDVDPETKKNHEDNFEPIKVPRSKRNIGHEGKKS